MHQRIVTTVRQLRQDLARHLDEKAVHEACRQAGHCWRTRLLTPVAIIHWFIIQVLHGNAALEHISLLADRKFTDSAYCQARANLPLRVYQAVLRSDQGPRAGYSYRGPLARTSSHFPGRRLVVFHARYTRAASSLRSARKSEARMRVPRGQHLGHVPRRYRAIARSYGRPIANP